MRTCDLRGAVAGGAMSYHMTIIYIVMVMSSGGFSAAAAAAGSGDMPVHGCDYECCHYF